MSFCVRVDSTCELLYNALHALTSAFNLGIMNIRI